MSEIHREDSASPRPRHTFDPAAPDVELEDIGGRLSGSGATVRNVHPYG